MQIPFQTYYDLLSEAFPKHILCAWWCESHGTLRWWGCKCGPDCSHSRVFSLHNAFQFCKRIRMVHYWFWTHLSDVSFYTWRNKARGGSSCTSKAKWLLGSKGDIAKVLKRVNGVTVDSRELFRSFQNTKECYHAWTAGLEVNSHL